MEIDAKPSNNEEKKSKFSLKYFWEKFKLHWNKLISYLKKWFSSVRKKIKDLNLGYFFYNLLITIKSILLSSTNIITLLFLGLLALTTIGVVQKNVRLICLSGLMWMAIWLLILKIIKSTKLNQK